MTCRSITFDRLLQYESLCCKLVQSCEPKLAEIFVLNRIVLAHMHGVCQLYELLSS
jgi:hypothetical protein